MADASTDGGHDHGHSHAHSHGHRHGHAHGHSHDTSSTGERRLAVAVAINIGLTVAQVVGGILSGSLALIADALHNFSDAISLIIALWARRLIRRPADKKMTFGWGRAEIVAALVNFTTLIMIGLYLTYEAVMRMFEPVPVEGWTVIFVAGVALLVDVVTAALTFAVSRNSMNIRAAFLHNVADAMASVGVIVGGIVVLLYDWTLIDPIVTLIIAGYVLWHGICEIGGAIRILMNAAPNELDTNEVAAAMAGVDGVAGIHHVHLWQFDESRNSLEAHVLVDSKTDAGAIKGALRRLLADEFGVRHTTLETELPGETCGSPEGGIQHP